MDVADSGKVVSPDVAPHQTGMLSLSLPDNWQSHDALYLTATDPHGQEICTWSWMLASPKYPDHLFTTCGQKVQGQQKNGIISMAACGVRVQIDAKTGLLSGVEADGVDVSFDQGLQLLGR